MSDDATLTMLNHAFVRLHRSFGQYIRKEAALDFDVAADVLDKLTERECADAQRLGKYIARERGNVDTSPYPIEFGSLHFLNVSWVLADWIRWQQKLVSGLEADRASIAPSAGSDPGVAILDEAIAHAKDALAKLKEIPIPVAV